MGLIRNFLFNSDKEGLKRRKSEKIINRHNNKILKRNFNFNAEDILILMPHCVQYKLCKIRITFNPENCNHCGQCDVGKLVNYCKNNNLKLAIATGGTLARRIIREIKPSAVVAVACHRDLLSGLKEIKKIPVIGILNQIGEDGPCVSTGFDLKEIKKVVNFFQGFDKKN
ncbi:MAG: DUF116 domain-containing protein [Candidatus Muiribacteriota bacterium]